MNELKLGGQYLFYYTSKSNPLIRCATGTISHICTDKYILKDTKRLIVMDKYFLKEAIEIEN